MSRDKIIVILGPTASGKSKLAVKLAKKIRGEIISADSRQVYKNLDIGSGKIPGAWKAIGVSNKQIILQSKIKNQKLKTQIKNKKLFIYQGTPHYCIDVASPKKIFTAQDFKKLAQKAIREIKNRGKIPIVCGGTGFYIDALFGGIEIPKVPPDWKLRKKLEKKSNQELFAILKKLNPRRAKNIDPKNKRRLIRAIEIVKSGSPTSRGSRTSKYEALFLGLTFPKEILKKRIEKRIVEMLKRGLVKEVGKLRRLGLSWKRIQEFGFEYKLPTLYLQNKISQEQMLASLKTENWRYAKRQMTWFKRNKHIRWLVPSNAEGIKSPSFAPPSLKATGGHSKASASALLASADKSAGKQREAEKLVKEFLK